MLKLPLFSELNLEDYAERLQTLLDRNRGAIAQLLASEQQWQWQTLMLPLEEWDDALDQFWGPVSHLHAVKNSDALRAVYQACLPKLSDYYTELGQNQDLFQAVQSLRESEAFAQYDQAQRKIIDDEIRDFHLAGVDLAEDKKPRYREIQQRLSELSTTFSNHVLDATQGWTLSVSLEQLAGLPERALAMAKQAAADHDQPGYLLTLDYPCYEAIITYADDPDLRKTLYTAFTTRASDQGPHADQWDNTPVMDEMLQLCDELAQLLDFSTYAEYSLATKMAASPKEVEDFLADLVSRVRPQAEQEYQALCAFAQEKQAVDELAPWDIPYYTEKLRHDKYDFSEEALRPYFPIDKVLQGLFTIIETLYGIRLVERQDVDSWHDDVRFFNLLDQAGKVCGGIYIDLYARRQKRGGAWMDECVVHRCSADGRLQLPVAYLNCNFAPASGGNPALLSHEEVLTLFHECGHCLHHLLTRVEYASASGINGVPWDAVEMPSQFFENWCWQREGLDLISAHYQTGEPLPQELLDKMLRAKHFQTALRLTRQLEFATFDWHLYNQTVTPATNIQAILDQVRQAIAILPTAPFNRFQNSFSHIFAGGYSAGYYSYLWAEVLACDAFGKFEETGILNANTGYDFKREILEKGGSQTPLALFTAFRGRPPTNEAFLRLNGVDEEL